MGFERKMTKYRCGCYSEEMAHDSFDYTESSEYRNVCGRHPSEESANEDHSKCTKMVEVIENARYALSQNMDTDTVACHLTAREVITKGQKDELLKCKSKQLKTRKLINMIVESKNISLHHLRMSLLKAGQPDLLPYISETKQKESNYSGDDEKDARQSSENRCMIELQGESFVVVKDFKGQTYINIRNYQTIEGKKYPTKQGVALTLSRWLVLETQKDFIDSVFKLCLTGEQVNEELIHLGGGVYVTLNSKYPTVDVRQFWKPEDKDKPIATKRGIPLNNIKWQKLCDSMKIMRDFVPELNSAVICRNTHNNQMEMFKCSECEPYHIDEDDDFVTQNQEGDFEIMKNILDPDGESE